MWLVLHEIGALRLKFVSKVNDSRKGITLDRSEMDGTAGVKNAFIGNDSMSNSTRKRICV